MGKRDNIGCAHKNMPRAVGHSSKELGLQYNSEVSKSGRGEETAAYFLAACHWRFEHKSARNDDGYRVVTPGQKRGIAMSTLHVACKQWQVVLLGEVT